MDRVKVTTEWAMILNVIWSIAEACGTGIKLTADPDVSQVMAVETCFIVMGVVWEEGCLSNVTGPMDLTPFYSL